MAFTSDDGPFSSSPKGAAPPDDLPKLTDPAKAGCALLTLGVGAVVGLFFVVVLGCAGFLWLGTSAIESDLTAQLRGNDVVVEYVGTLSSADLNLGAGLGEGPGVYVLDVVGSEGSGRVRVLTVDTGGKMRILGGTIETDDAPPADLFPDGAPIYGGGYGDEAEEGW